MLSKQFGYGLVKRYLCYNCKNHIINVMEKLFLCTNKMIVFFNNLKYSFLGQKMYGV